MREKTSLNEQISEAVSIFRASRNLDDKGIYEVLILKGFEHRRAARLVEFLPLAYGRFLLGKSGARFSDAYQRMLPGGVSEERPLSSEPVWNAALTFARTESENGISVENFFAVAGRSAEFQAANQLLNKGSKLENLAFTPYLLPWPESGPLV